MPPIVFYTLLLLLTQSTTHMPNQGLDTSSVTAVLSTCHHSGPKPIVDTSSVSVVLITCKHSSHAAHLLPDSPMPWHNPIPICKTKALACFLFLTCSVQLQQHSSPCCLLSRRHAISPSRRPPWAIFSIACRCNAKRLCLTKTLKQLLPCCPVHSYKSTHPQTITLLCLKLLLPPPIPAVPYIHFMQVL